MSKMRWPDRTMPAGEVTTCHADPTTSTADVTSRIMFDHDALPLPTRRPALATRPAGSAKARAKAAAATAAILAQAQRVAAEVALTESLKPRGF